MKTSTLKVQGRHFRYKVGNKCLNVRQEIKIVPSLTLLLCKLSVFVKGNLDRKKFEEHLNFPENSNFITECTKAGFRVCSNVNSLKNTHSYGT